MKLIVNYFLLLALSISILAGCQNSPSKGNESQSTIENKPALEMQPSTSTPTIEDIHLSDAISIERKIVEGNPESTITFLIGDQRYIVTEPSECSVLSADEYKDYGIPISAESACQCWWAGSGADYIIRQGASGVQIFKRLTDESKQSQSSAWILLKSL